MSKITVLRLRILKKMDELIKDNDVKFVTAKRLAESLEINPNRVRRLLCDMKRAGLVDNPIYGGYRLTEEGRKALEFIK